MFDSLKASWVFLSLLLCCGCNQNCLARDKVYVTAPDRPMTQLAAKELQRYVYLRTGDIIHISDGTRKGEDGIVLSVNPELKAQEYELKTKTVDSNKQIWIQGGSELAVLYGAYHVIEKLGVRFYLHGDVIPDKKTRFVLPDLYERHSPLFELRGIQPFHDFPEGPDWWEANDYKTCFSQLVKMRMNFLGLHCYGESRRSTENAPAEVLVWLGLKEDVEDDGRVKSGYETYWANTVASGKWGYSRTKTSDFASGAGLLFDKDYFGHSLYDNTKLRPTNELGYTLYDYESATDEEMAHYNDVFNNAGDFFNDTFGFGRSLGVRIAIGTEAPLLHIPHEVNRRLEEKDIHYDPSNEEAVRLLFEGMFDRIEKAYSVDYFWLWTHEGWLGMTSDNWVVPLAVKHKQIAYDVLKEMGNPFKLATAGWTLGPKDQLGLFDASLPKDVPFSCINRHVGFHVVDRTFNTIHGRDKWAIPWMEDDAAMNVPQLWVGRTRKDAADAHAMGCNGLMGIHWRTKILSPTFAALARAGWDQSEWNPDFGKPLDLRKEQSGEYRMGGWNAEYPDVDIKGTEDDWVYRTCRWNVDGYKLTVPDGTYTVTLKFCENHFKQSGQRVFNVSINGHMVEKELDIVDRVGAHIALDLVYPQVIVKDGYLKLDFGFLTDRPLINGIIIEGVTADHNQIKGTAYKRQISCGDREVAGYDNDLPVNGQQKSEGVDRDLSSSDLYADWCRYEFGDEVAQEMSDLFDWLDGGKGDYSLQRNQRHLICNLPQPSNWIGGPGGIYSHTSDWETDKGRYAFVDRMESLRTRVKGAGNLERFDYWLSSFKYVRAVGQAACLKEAYKKAIADIRKMPAGMQQQFAREELLPIRMKLARLWEEMVAHLVDTASTPGELGTIANMEQHVRRNGKEMQIRFLEGYDKELRDWLGEDLPAEASPSTQYQAKPRIIVPSVRSLIRHNEQLQFKVIVLDQDMPKDVSVFWRPLGKGEYSRLPVRHVDRRTYRASFPRFNGQTIEYYIKAKASSGEILHWPATAPETCQTVVEITE